MLNLNIERELKEIATIKFASDVVDRIYQTAETCIDISAIYALMDKEKEARPLDTYIDMLQELSSSIMQTIRKIEKLDVEELDRVGNDLNEVLRSMVQFMQGKEFVTLLDGIAA